MNAVNLVKRRSIAADMIKHNLVSVNNQVVKASKMVKTQDVISINYFAGTKHYKILQIPIFKSIPKSLQDQYVKTVDE